MKYKTDGNQTEIIEALRAAGYYVFDCSRMGRGFPDLLVNSYARVVLMEVKTDGGRLTPAEAKFHAEYKGELYIVRSVEDALIAMGKWEK